MEVLIGTSGFSYPAWRGGFYPEKLPETKMLGYYGGHFRAVEINNSFYRMPTAEVLGRWAGETPPEFRFALKSPRRITHDKRLVDTASAVERLTEASRALGDKLGPVLFQLPPNMKKDLPRLDDFLAALPAGLRATVEFRHESWFSDDVYGCLRTRGAALCIAESDELRDAARGDHRLGIPAPATRELRRHAGRQLGRPHQDPGLVEGLRVLQARGHRQRAGRCRSTARAHGGVNGHLNSR